MSLIGYPDLDRPVAFGSGRLFHSYGGGPFRLQPSECGVLAGPTGSLDWHLDVVRTLAGGGHATFSCTVGAVYAEEEALLRAREVDPAAVVAPVLPTTWWFRVPPSPALEQRGDLTAPVALASSGLGTGRLLLPLTVHSGLLLESLLRDGGPLEGVAEAEVEVVSPRVPAVVRFDPAALLADLAEHADSQGALPRRLLEGYFARDLDTLPLTVTATADLATDLVAGRFAEAMADRVVARFGAHVPAADAVDAPVVRLDLDQPGGSVTWSLSQPVLATRRLVLPVDLMSAAREQADRDSVDSLVERRDLAVLPSLGAARVTALCTVPPPQAGLDLLGVRLTFPPYPPYRPHPRTATAVFDTDDTVPLQLRLTPGEPLRYRWSTFAVVTDDLGSGELQGSEQDGEGPVLRVSAHDFPVELVVCEATPALAELAVVTCSCTYELDGQRHRRLLVLDSGSLAATVAVPRTRQSLGVEVTAVERDGSGLLHLGPFETGQVRLDVASFPSYGPHEAVVGVQFDDGATLRALSLLPMGVEEAPEAVTTVAFTPAEPARTYRWFAHSPFRAGFRYRTGSEAPWTDVPSGADLTLRSSDLAAPPVVHEVAVRAATPLQERLPVRPRSATESAELGAGSTEAEPVHEAGIVPVATCPSQTPTDEVVYTWIAEPGRKGYVPRYSVDVRLVSSQQRYRIALAQTSTASTLTLHLVAATPPAVAAQAPEATELPHLLSVQLDFLVTTGSGARKTLDFTDVTRNGEVVTATLTFATLAERDDVYSALTDRDRSPRLLVRRYVDVLLLPPGSSAVDTGSPDRVLLPVRPIGTLPGRVLRLPGPLPPTPVMVARDLVARDLVAPDMVARRADERALSPARERDIVDRLEPEVPLRFEPRLPKEPVLPVDRIDRHLPRPRPIPVDKFTARLPDPVLRFVSRNPEAGLTRCWLSVENWAQFSDEFFAASPDLPPCGLNKSASRTWVDIEDADTGARLYGYCALGAGKNLSSLWFAVQDGGRMPANVRVRLKDRRAGVEKVSNPVSTSVPEPKPEPPPEPRPVRAELAQTVAPEPFAFSPSLHAYIFQGVTPGSGSGSGELVQFSFPWQGPTHLYLQDATRPSLVYVLPDRFNIARRQEPPFTPYATVRVTMRADGSTTDVVFDYVVAPRFDPRRLADARARLLADPRFGASTVEFQQLVTSDVQFWVDRPTAAGSAQEQRADVALVLQGFLKDTLTMPLADFKLLFDAMHRRTAALFVGKVVVGLPGGTAKDIPFSARMDDLEGPLFTSEAAWEPDGTVRVNLANAIESPVDLQTLDVVLTQGDQAVSASVVGGLPRTGLLPGAAAEVRVTPQQPVTATDPLELSVDRHGVVVRPDPEAIWNAILDRTTVEFFTWVTVKVVPAVFEPVAGREDQRILEVLVDFEGGGTVALSAAAAEGRTRVDHPIDHVILGRPFEGGHRYQVTVVRVNGTVEEDPNVREARSDTFYVSVTR